MKIDVDLDAVNMAFLDMSTKSSCLDLVNFTGLMSFIMEQSPNVSGDCSYAIQCMRTAIEIWENSTKTINKISSRYEKAFPIYKYI